MEKNLWISIKELFLLPEFDNSSPSAIRDQEICPSHVLIRWWLNWILWMRFTWCPNLMFLAFPWLERYRFSNWPFCCPWAIKVDSHSTVGQVRIEPTRSFKWLCRSQLFYWCWARCCTAKNNPTLSARKKIQEPCIGSGTSHFQWFSQLELRTEFSS